MARLRRNWQRLGAGRQCAGRVLVHLDGGATCSGKCDDIEHTYHPANPAACRGKKGPAFETCSRCTGRSDLDLSGMVGSATSLLQVVNGIRQTVAPFMANTQNSSTATPGGVGEP